LQLAHTATTVPNTERLTTWRDVGATQLPASTSSAEGKLDGQTVISEEFPKIAEVMVALS
jgi:hypothetical protein